MSPTPTSQPAPEAMGMVNSTSRRLPSVAAEPAKEHPQTLRIYERKGLVEPARTQGGSRRYSDADIAHLQRIQDLTDEGLNLAGVKRVLALEDEVRRLEDEIERLRQTMDEAVDRTHRQYRRDLVPVSQAVVRYGQARALFRDR